MNVEVVVFTGTPYLHGIHSHGSQIVGVLLVPCQSQQWMMLWVLIDDGRVFKVS